jgi:N-acetyl-gamma-glutamyl-phosphate reductase
MRPRVFIDGHVGTVGLRIREWLAGRRDLDVVTLPESQRKDDAARKAAARDADVAVLCLSDEMAREVAGWELGQTRLLDASTAHRVADGWTYGMPELVAGQRDAIAKAARVSNPGCWPTGVLLLLRPLFDAGHLGREIPLTVHGLSGYTGGGKSLIEKWEEPAGGLLALKYEAPYALERVHKHVPEMLRWSGLSSEPHFVPAVGPFRCGMRVEIPVHQVFLDTCHEPTTAKSMWETLVERYRGERFVRVAPFAEGVAVHERSLDPQAANDTNRIDLHVVPHPSGHVLLVAILDNLGKGAAGAAIQNLNLMLGLDEGAGLVA